ncbi:MAG: hypothetical protein ACRD4P_16800, partial [Bryobacteraceae bacterium]
MSMFEEFSDETNPSRVIKLNLRQNALHTLHHAVEHLHWSETETDQRDGRSFDPRDYSVQW